MLKQRGFSLVELIVAMAIGVIISAALAGLFVSSTKVKQEINRNGEQIENGRLAMDWLSQDIRLAGYWDGLEYTDPTNFPDPSLPDLCETDTADLKSAVPVYIQGVDQAAASALSTCASHATATADSNALNDVKSGTDIVAVRRAGTCVVGSAGCESQAPYFQASNCTPPAERLDGTTGVVGQGAELGSPVTANWHAVDTSTGSMTLHKRDCGNATLPGAPNLANIRRYVSRIYYIANNDRLVSGVGDGLPSLKMAELRGTTWTVSTIASGIEEMHVEYGQTSGGDTTVESYVTAPASVGGWRQVVAAKVHLLSRNSTPTPQYNNTVKTYSLGRKADGTENVFGPFNDSVRRHAFTGLISIRNPAGLQGG